MNFTFTGGAGVIENRVTEPDPPGGSNLDEGAAEFAYWQMGLSEKYHDYLDNVVSTNAALHYAAVWACVRWISQTIASLGWHLYERKDKRREQVDLGNNIAWILDMQPNEETTAFAWREVMLSHALTEGNGYSETVKDGFGRVREVVQLGRGRVNPDRTESGQLIYEVKNGSGVKNTILLPSEMFHLKGMGDDGIVGYSVIEMARRTISSGRNEEKFGDDFFSRGPTPGGIFTSPTKLSETAEKQARKSFDELYSGRKNVGRVIRITGAATFTPLSLPNTDAQFLESRKFSVEEICRWFGVPPHKIQHLERSTFNNIEHQAIEAVQDCLLPWCRRLESEADVKFFGRVNRGRMYTRLNIATMLRGDTLSQSEALTKQVNGGIRQINEARELLDLNPIDGGDTTLVQGAMVPLERALEPPPEPQAPAPMPAEPDDDEPPTDEPSQDVAAAFTQLLADAYGRLLRVEADKAKRAANKNRLAAHVAEFYVEKEQAEFAGILSPIFAAFLIAAGRNSIAPSALAAAASERHFAWAKQILTSAGAVPDDWAQRAPDLAAAELKLAWEKSR